MSRGKLYIKLMNSREWRETRARKLAANPLCEMCEADGYVRAAQCIHHIVEVESGHTEQECRELCFRWTNLQSLCYECHRKIHEALRYRSKDAHHVREADRLSQWVKKHEEKRKNC